MKGENEENKVKEDIAGNEFHFLSSWKKKMELNFVEIFGYYWNSCSKLFFDNNVIHSINVSVLLVNKILQPLRINTIEFGYNWNTLKVILYC